MMLSNFTIDKSFYYIEQHHIDTFKQTVEKFSKYKYLLNTSLTNKEDSWAIAFHIWLLFIPNNNIVENVRISMYYRSCNIIKKELLKNPYFHRLKHHHNTSDELLFITTLLITNSVIDWSYKILKKNDLLSLVNITENASLLETHKYLKDEKSFFEMQAIFIKLLVWEFKSSNQFHELIKSNCKKAQMIYEKNKVLQKNE